MNDRHFHLSAGSEELGLHLQWAHDGDRLRSILSLVDRGQRTTILHSVGPSEPHDDWPPSPPYQHGQAQPSQPGVILLTGMAASTHWSASIEQVESNKGCGFRWDVACRVKTPPLRLGSAFRWHELAHLVSEETDWASWRLFDRWFRVALDTPAQSVGHLETGDRDFRVVPGFPEAIPDTIRWRFDLTMQISEPGSSVDAPHLTP